MNLLLLTSHAIAERDDLDMFTRMPGVDVFSIGGAYDEVPFEGMRPGLPGVVRYPELEAATARQRERLARTLGDPGEYIDWAKAIIAPEVLDWAETIVVHHFPEHWIGGQWDLIRKKRVIWRTCGQSNPNLENFMARFRRMGLQVVRYSPKEREAFPRLGAFAGEDACIRFGKDPEEWSGWTGTDQVVGNITQNMAQRGDACGLVPWSAATEGLPVKPAGKGSEILPGGIGMLDFPEMVEYLRSIRCYLYTGTRPASYTLGLIEAMMTGVPVVSISPDQFGPAAPLYEGLEIAGNGPGAGNTDPITAIRRDFLEPWLADRERAAHASRVIRQRAIELFGLDTIMAQWADFLGVTQ